MGIDMISLSAPTSLLLAGLCILSPFVIVWLVGGSPKALKGVMPITIVSVISFYVPFYVISAFVGPELSVTIGAIISLVAVVIMGRKSSGDIPEEYLLEKKDEEAGAAASAKPQMSVAKAWIPYVLIVIFILGSSKLVPPINSALGAIKSTCLLYTSRCV